MLTRSALIMSLAAVGCDGDRTLICPEPAETERELVTSTTDAEPGHYTTLVVDCPDDAELVSGGCVAGGYHDSMIIVASVPESPEAPGSEGGAPTTRSWVCTAWLDEDANPGVVQAWALCEVTL